MRFKTLVKLVKDYPHDRVCHEWNPQLVLYLWYVVHRLVQGLSEQRQIDQVHLGNVEHNDAFHLV